MLMHVWATIFMATLSLGALSAAVRAQNQTRPMPAGGLKMGSGQAMPAVPLKLISTRDKLSTCWARNPVAVRVPTAQ
jgi:hypothetical protein